MKVQSLLFYVFRFSALGITAAVVLLTSSIGSPLYADPLGEALRAGTVGGQFRLRYEDVDQDRAPSEAQALTLRTRITYTSGAISNFSALLEMEDVRIVGGVNDYSLGAVGFHPGEHASIADPGTTELDQAFLQYKRDGLELRGGRQAILLNDHRFVGDVGWRQDRQTFDAMSALYSPSETLSLSYAHMT